jgi:transposase
MTKDNKKNNRYSIAEKERLVARMFPPEDISLADLAKETGISKSTLATWKYKAAGKPNKVNVNKPCTSMSSREKFLIVIETYIMSEI